MTADCYFVFVAVSLCILAIRLRWVTEVLLIERREESIVTFPRFKP
jgi:hypothetical protein